MNGLLRSIFILGLLMWPMFAKAHKQSDSYLSITATTGSSELQGQWDIALRDLDFVIGLDTNADDRITWREVKAQGAAIRGYAFDHLRLASVGGAGQQDCPLHPQQMLIDEHVDGAYAVLRFSASCATAPERLAVNYTLLFAADPNHRGLLDLRTENFSQAAVLSVENSSVSIDARSKDSWQQLQSFVAEGIWHIWQGYDHILFLFTLLLPAVVLYRDGRWQPRASLRDSSGDILKIVTAFTLAHSLTLSLAALGVVHVPSRLVESAIALTVLLGALNILFPVVRERRWLVALCFGLIHGLGFASVLADLGLRPGGLLQALVGFNIGVEIGQLAIVVLLMPMSYLLRDTFFYRRLVLPAGATAISFLALYWIGLRAFPTLVPAL